MIVSKNENKHTSSPIDYQMIFSRNLFSLCSEVRKLKRSVQQMIRDTTLLRNWTSGSDEVIVLRHSCRLVRRVFTDVRSNRTWFSVRSSWDERMRKALPDGLGGSNGKYFSSILLLQSLGVFILSIMKVESILIILKVFLSKINQNDKQKCWTLCLLILTLFKRIHSRTTDLSKTLD